MSLGDALFDSFMYPLEIALLRARRRARIPQARGVVLEIGVGTGANLRYYAWHRIRELHALDLAPGNRLSAVTSFAGVPVVTHTADAQDLPFSDGSVDIVVATLVFCSVTDPARGLAEILRVLRPGGRYIFIEHVRPEERGIRCVTDTLSPWWLALNRRCRLDRETLITIGASGLVVEALHRSGGGILVDGVARRPGTSLRVWA